MPICMGKLNPRGKIENGTSHGFLRKAKKDDEGFPTQTMSHGAGSQSCGQQSSRAVEISPRES
jgi:hypothetical protein